MTIVSAKKIPKIGVRLARGTDAYCPRCWVNLPEYGMKKCDNCFLVFGMLRLIGHPMVRVRPSRMTRSLSEGCVFEKSLVTK